MNIILQSIFRPRWVIETPRGLNREQKEALRKFSDTLGESNYEQRKSFFGKFKL